MAHTRSKPAPKPQPTATIGFDGTIRVSNNSESVYGHASFAVTAEQARILATALLTAAAQHEMVARVLGTTPN